MYRTTCGHAAMPGPNDFWVAEGSTVPDAPTSRRDFGVDL